MAKPEILNTSHNVIAKDTIVKGEIITKGDFRIDGTVEGEIKSEGRIIIGNEGKLIGTIDAVNVDIMGSVEGEVKAKDTLSLKSTGKIRGKIQTNIL
jgi:cytoskeletal protein CcmA (bactofilin family)